MSGVASSYEPLNHDDIPVAAFTQNTVSGVNPLPVCFTDASTPNSGNHEVDSWGWDFGDGTTSTEQNPSHRFTAVGTYTVVLTVSNDVGHNTAQQQIVVTTGGPNPPTPLDGCFTFWGSITGVVPFPAGATPYFTDVIVWLRHEDGIGGVIKEYSDYLSDYCTDFSAAGYFYFYNIPIPATGYIVMYVSYKIWYSTPAALAGKYEGEWAPPGDYVYLPGADPPLPSPLESDTYQLLLEHGEVYFNVTYVG